MSRFDYARTAGVVAALLARFGDDATVVIASDAEGASGSEWRGAGSPSGIAVSACLVDRSALRPDGVAIGAESGFALCRVPAGGEDLSDASGFAFAGSVYRVVSIEVLAPAGVPVLYEFGLAR